MSEKEERKKWFDEYINRGLGLNIIPFPSLLKELQDYKPTYISSKVAKIYHLAIKRGKLSLAAKILKKYPELNEIKYDITIAAGFSMLANKVKQVQNGSNNTKE